MHKLKEDKERSLQCDIQQGQASAEDSLNIGRGILGTLSEQNEKQLASADNVETTEYVLQRSMRVLRGMTWSGMFYNMVTKESEPTKTISHTHRQHPNITDTVDVREHYQNRRELLDGTGNTSRTCDEEMERLAGSVQKLEDVSLTINRSLQAQAQLADDLTEKTEDVNNAMLATLLRTAQLTQRAKKTSEVEIGIFYFQQMGSNQYLCVNGTQVVLCDRFDRSAIFRVFSKESHLMGLQNMKTFKFLGINMWGSVTASSAVFGTYEETFIDLDGFRRTPGIFFLAPNWGGGGWLQQPLATESSNQKDTLPICTSVTKGISDCTSRLQLVAKPMLDEDFDRLCRLNS
mmetsp:Transcript_13491/g.20278  ORF Transcript_13491/g.20278 Transcript_13491/m.20278 type:complete len:347 (+) Transcript_13491:73-1113(+)|eukprot:CAMPEP_0185041148 /NCGR_PEP_ID=MMETSP1103-20130426/40058_1 /TAXON_ID=36769 /ORGANISM="Paraphysomonas bandaiensis, Strain Caron Lab Isolate" /LENGTH=346 /DNA_ID=CAMNT_0027580753 /DNA_START=1 /DNA_END=1041 /DNA_ORIENTATION=+